MKLSVVMPVYNEAASIAEIVRRVLASPLVAELVVVDDASTDGCGAIIDGIAAADARVRVRRHARNRGKGAAVRTGLADLSGDAVVIQDADLEYDPADFEKLLEPIAAGRAEVVFGSRYFGRRRHPNQRAIYYLANRCITFASNRFTGLALTDVESCYKCLRRDVLERLSLAEERFGLEVELTAKVAALGCRILEVPVDYSPRSRAEGKTIGLGDGLEALVCIIRYWWQSKVGPPI